MFAPEQTPEQQEIERLTRLVLELKSELYDTVKDNAAQTAAMTQAYSAALLQASEVFKLSFEGRAPASVAEFQAALNELVEKEYTQGP